MAQNWDPWTVTKWESNGITKQEHNMKRQHSQWNWKRYPTGRRVRFCNIIPGTDSISDSLILIAHSTEGDRDKDTALIHKSKTPTRSVGSRFLLSAGAIGSISTCLAHPTGVLESFCTKSTQCNEDPRGLQSCSALSCSSSSFKLWNNLFFHLLSVRCVWTMILNIFVYD